MELADYLNILRKRWISIIACALLGALAAGAWSLLTTPTYTATSTVFVTVSNAQTAGDLNQGSTFAANQVRSYAEVVTMPIVLDPVATKLNNGLSSAKLAKEVSATVPTNTALIQIAVVDTNPQRAADIANAVSAQTVSTVDALAPTGTDKSRLVRATIVAPAGVPNIKTAPKNKQNVALGFTVGLLVGVVQAILRSLLDTRVNTEDDIDQVTDASVVGRIAYDSNAPKNPLVFQDDPHSLRAEDYRRLRTNLQFVGIDRNRSFVVTSSLAGEGKTTTAINIASALADAGDNVLLVDADLRRPRVASYLDMDNSLGLTSLLIGRTKLENVVQDVHGNGLHVLTAGQVPPNPAELLSSEEMREFLAKAVETYDTVIIDAPPLLPVTDAAVLSTIAGGALLVVGSGLVTRPQLASAIDSLKDVDGHLLGLVLNRFQRQDARRYGYHHGYYAETKAEAANPSK